MRIQKRWPAIALRSPACSVPSYRTLPDAEACRTSTYVPAPEKTSPLGALCERDDVRRRRRRPAELPRGDDESGERSDADEREHDRTPLEAQLVLRRAPAHGRVDEVLDREARLVLVHVQLPVESEEVGVGTEEALHVRLGREHVEVLLLERAQVLRTDLRRKLGLRDVEALAGAGLAQADSELEHLVTDCRRTKDGELIGYLELVGDEAVERRRASPAASRSGAGGRCPPGVGGAGGRAGGSSPRRNGRSPRCTGRGAPPS